MQQQDEVRELQEELYSLKSLASHSGYKLFVEVLNAQAVTRRDAVILTPLETMDQVLKQEFQKGETAGLLMAVQFIEVHSKALEEQIDHLLAQRENSDEHADDDSTNSTGE